VSFLLDTNVLSELRKGRRGHASVRAWTEANGWSVLYTSWVVIAEMKRGAALVARHDRVQAIALEAWIVEALRRLEDRVLPVDRAVAEIWPALMIPDPRPAMDALIAATALAHELTLVTRNERDFAVAGVAVLYQRRQEVTDAHDRVAIDVMRSGAAVSAFHASQQASTMVS
jgi:toxin FitB